MPELPEVETIARALVDVLGKSIVGVKIYFGPEYLEKLKGERIVNVSRRGKFLVFEMTGCFLLVHLRMSGKFLIRGWNDIREKHEQVIFDLEGGDSLRFFDPRKFGRLYLVNDPEEILGKLGPEPLEWELDSFMKALGGRGRALKPLLLDQSFIAGIGNIYADEALWQAKLHPLRLASSLSKSEALSLYEAIQNVLKRGIATKGTSLGTGLANFQHVNGESGKHQIHLDVYGRGGMGCKRCQTEIVKTKVAQRGTHLCPKCQIQL